MCVYDSLSRARFVKCARASRFTSVVCRSLSFSLSLYKRCTLHLHVFISRYRKERECTHIQRCEPIEKNVSIDEHGSNWTNSCVVVASEPKKKRKKKEEEEEKRSGG